MTEELYKKYRPKKFKELKGQPVTSQIYKLIKNKKFPHATLFAGPSGCGKTTLARIIRDKLGCSDSDFNEVNCADFRGIDMVREIRGVMNLAPMGGGVRVWLIDEAHQLSSAAQNAILKILEDTPSHVYFILATTEPQKLLKTIRTRCTTFTVNGLNYEDSQSLITSVCEQEQVELTEDVVDALVKYGDGSPRQILVLLDSIINIEDEEEQLHAIYKSETKREAIEICRALFQPNPSWSQIASIINSLTEEPESLRWMIIGYAKSLLLKQKVLNAKSMRAYRIIEAFKVNFYDSKLAGLTAACFEVCFDDE
jgi:DNA polymerase III gamma/tau subunit